MSYCGRVINKLDGTALKHVPVSDGLNISLTDSNGYFELKGWSKAQFVFVMLLTSKHNDWYIHTENHSGDYIFYIDPVYITSEYYSFLHISDTEIENKKCTFIPLLQKLVAEHKPAFLIHTGDLCRDDGVKRHYRIMNSNTIGCPVRYTIGNHDFLDGPYGEYTYERLYGPLWYSFDCGNIHFIASPIKKGDFPSGYDQADFWNWFENDIKMLEPNKKIIMFNHTLCDDTQGFKPTINAKTYDLKKLGLKAWIFGHYHIHSTNNYSGVLNICTAEPSCGGIDSSPAGVRKINVFNNSISTDIIFSSKSYIPDDCEWETVLPGHIQFSSPLAYKNSVIVCTNDDGFPKQCGIFCLESESGKIKWQFMTKNGFKADAALYNERVYAEDSSGTIYCLDAQSGKLIWQTAAEIKKIDDARLNIVVANEMVFGGCPGFIQAFDSKTGEHIWSSEQLACENSPARNIFDAQNNQLIVNAHWLCMYAIDVRCGLINWKQVWQGTSDFPCPAWFRSATPLLHNGLIYASGNTGAFILNSNSGQLILQKNLGYHMDVSSRPVICDNKVYMATSDSGVLALDAKTLEILKVYPTSFSGLYTSPYQQGDNLMTVESPLQIHGNQLIFGASDGAIYFYDKNTAKLQNKIQLGASILTEPIINKDSVIAADFYAAVRKYKI